LWPEKKKKKKKKKKSLKSDPLKRISGAAIFPTFIPTGAAVHKRRIRKRRGV
jgi:hypothetical protein